MTDLVPFEERDAWIPVVDKIAELSKQLAQTPFVGAFRGKPGDVFGAILYGHHLHLAPLQALQSFDLIEGKPTLKSEARRALFLREGHRLEILQWDAKRCTVRAERSDGLASVEVTYTMEDAQLAGLAGKKNWRTHPKQMLLARTSAMAISAVAPDVALGIDVADAEGQERPSQPGGLSVVQLPAPAPEPTPAPPASAITAPAPVTEQRTDEPPAGVSTEPAEPLGPEPITPPQMRKISAQIRELERLDERKFSREERREFIGTLVGIPDLGSANDLTKEEASRAIEELARVIGDAMERAEADPVVVTETGEIQDPEGVQA